MDKTELLAKAKEASKNAYAPYSNFKVGACVLFDSGNFYTGCNVENVSYGLSLCAERNAISNAISNGEQGKLVSIAIYSPNTEQCVPCGACRQWLVEFSKEAEIILEDKQNKIISYNINNLLPEAFSPEKLKD
ncbi:MAG: cytidine deaminase [Candidatus Gastranaerophilales bacterium]|nr:cytidine deaminase [Candidatus Gastranaerophilales bacterium]